MSRPVLAFRTVGVRRMPGITDGGWELSHLSPGVNVVWGPNGAGKTTSASAVERLLWPAAFRDGRPQLDARIVLDGAEWRVELDGTAPRWQRDGQDSAAPAGIPSDAERDRYRISLHELLAETDKGLAERILHESAGGFDVGAAARELEFRKGASNPYGVKQGVRNARARVREVHDEQGRLREDEARLGAVQTEAAGHHARASRQELWGRALDRLDALEQAERAREALAHFPKKPGGSPATKRSSSANCVGRWRPRTSGRAVHGARSRKRAAPLLPRGCRRTDFPAT